MAEVTGGFNKDGLDNVTASSGAGVDIDSSVKTYTSIISDEDMATTLKTLLALEQHTDIFRSKSCKALRAVVHQLQQTATATTGMGE